MVISSIIGPSGLGPRRQADGPRPVLQKQIRWKDTLSIFGDEHAPSGSPELGDLRQSRRNRLFRKRRGELGLSGASLSKALQRLAAGIGEGLIYSTPRGFALTETGRVLAVRAARILAESEAAEAVAHDKSAAPRGRVRLAAPMSFGLRHVAPALPAFLAAYPG